MIQMRVRSLLLCGVVGLAGCAVDDSVVAHRAQRVLVGLREVDLVACLGSPDQHTSFPGTDVLTWYSASSSAVSLAPPIVGGISLSFGGNCHITARADDGIVTNVLYSGEKNAIFATDAFCAPLVTTCLGYLDAHPPVRPASAHRIGASGTMSGAQPVAAGAVSAAPQPGVSHGSLPSNTPTSAPN
ncbi:hypothetical protein [Lichenicoccus sp.]|uniref:hypothetical protein n=1 Tax=Lichenicoccus sp. TaxID=2781899 RepID=UPI003D12B348